MSMLFIVILIGFFFGVFDFSNIVYPIFSARPRAKKLEREGKLVKPIPEATFFVAPIVWGAVLIGTIWLVRTYFQEHSLAYELTLFVAFLIVCAQIPRRNKDLEADFATTWGEYLKK